MILTQKNRTETEGAKEGGHQPSNTRKKNGEVTLSMKDEGIRNWQGVCVTLCLLLILCGCSEVCIQSENVTLEGNTVKGELKISACKAEKQELPIIEVNEDVTKKEN